MLNLGWNPVETAMRQLLQPKVAYRWTARQGAGHPGGERRSVSQERRVGSKLFRLYRVEVTTTYDGLIHLWELGTGRKRAVLTGHRDSVYAIAFSPDGRYLAGGGADGQILLWDLWRR